MTTTTADQINALIASNTALKEYFEGQRASIDAAVAGAQAAYSALAADMITAAKSTMQFTATIDPDGVADMRNGGLFNTIRDALNFAGATAYVVLTLTSGKTHPIAQAIDFRAQVVRLTASGLNTDTDATRPVIAPAAYIYNNANVFYGFRPIQTSNLMLQGCNINLPAAADGGLLWGSAAALMQASVGGSSVLGFDRCKISAQNAGCGLVSAQYGCNATLGLRDTELVGPLTACLGVTNGTMRIAKYNLTLSNGAVLYTAGTVGQNIVSN